MSFGSSQRKMLSSKGKPNKSRQDPENLSKPTTQNQHQVTQLTMMSPCHRVLLRALHLAVRSTTVACIPVSMLLPPAQDHVHIDSATQEQDTLHTSSRLSLQKNAACVQLTLDSDITEVLSHTCVSAILFLQAYTLLQPRTLMVFLQRY